MLSSKFIDFTIHTALISLIFSEYAHTGESSLLQANKIIFAGLELVVAFDMVHNKDGHALLDQLLVIKVTSLLQSFLLYAHLLLLKQSLVKGLDPELEVSFALGSIDFLCDLLSLLGFCMELLKFYEDSRQGSSGLGLLKVLRDCLQLLIVDCHM